MSDKIIFLNLCLFLCALIGLQSNSKLFFMPFFYQQNINETTHLAIWAIEEPLSYFEEEMQLVVDIQNEERKIQHLAVRWLLKLMMPEVELSQIEMAPNGKPWIPGGNFHFSFSHCKGYAAVAVSDTHPIGIDIELIQERIAKVAHKFLHKDEKLLIDGIAPSLQLKQMGFNWAAKEAMYKMYEKNGIDFSEHFKIPALALEAYGNLNATIQHQGATKQVNLSYNFGEDFVCVTCYH
jgi:phosphopantetheinyl transferase